MKSAEYWIAKLDLKNHPEGGYFSETYRSEGLIARGSLPSRYLGSRSYATSIYYLLESGDFSSLHRIQSNELWFYHEGSALTVHCISPEGNYSAIKIGKDITRGESLFACVPHGTWFGATVDEPNSFSLVSCVVAPGFDFDDFELAQKDVLIEKFPQHKTIIEKLIRE